MSSTGPPEAPNSQPQWGASRHPLGIQWKRGDSTPPDTTGFTPGFPPSAPSRAPPPRHRLHHRPLPCSCRPPLCSVSAHLLRCAIHTIAEPGCGCSHSRSYVARGRQSQKIALGSASGKRTKPRFRLFTVFAAYCSDPIPASVTETSLCDEPSLTGVILCGAVFLTRLGDKTGRRRGWPRGHPANWAGCPSCLLVCRLPKWLRVNWLSTMKERQGCCLR